MRFFIELQYNGESFNGWQIQPNAKTVQQELNYCLSTLIKAEIKVVGAGRTDAGVHANFMVAHFDFDKNLEADQLVHQINSFLPKSINIIKIYRVNNNAHARFTATKRTYKYFISVNKNPFNKNYFHFYKKLNIKKMNKACKYLIGKKDFTSFSKLHSDNLSNDCNIFFAGWQQEKNILIFTISSNRFLRNMVRAIVGTLIEVGLERISSEEIIKIINQKDRSKAGFSVPACGLFLEEISYPKSIYNV